jgi:hypothetical protein
MVDGMTWLAVWAFLKRIPWPLWAFLAIVLAFWWYGEHKESSGKAQVRAEWAQAVRKGREEIARLDQQNAADDERARILTDGIKRQTDHDNAMALAAKDRTITGLRTGTIQLRRQFQACLSDTQAAGAAPGADEPDPGPGLRGADTLDMAGAVGRSIFAGDEADAQIRGWTAYADVLREQCR